MKKKFIIHFKFRRFVFIDLDLAFVDTSNLFHFKYPVLITMDQPLVEDLTSEAINFHLIFI